MASTTSRSELDDDRCFFGKITSAKANEILLNEGREDGTFLVRESSSSHGNYVLSVIIHGEPTHILIHKYQDDAFFKIIVGEDEVFHGLDTLVNHYYENPLKQFNIKLSHSCCGDVLPAEVRLHGSSNLLHRSTSQGNINIVAELLKSGYKKKDDKNHNGQVALHIACIKGHQEIARLLLQTMTCVEVRDEEGVTPLHLASRYNRPAIIRLLVEMGKANIQARASKTGNVALHEAAQNGCTESVKVLLALYAPPFPRNTAGETPSELAAKYDHEDCCRMIVNHHVPRSRYSLSDYLHLNVDRYRAQERLLDVPNSQPGLFLMRNSIRKNGAYVLTLLNGKQVYNYEISSTTGMYCIDDGPYFSSLEFMIDHYIRFMDGLPCRLHTPLPPPEPLPEDKVALPASRQRHNTLPSSFSDGGGSSEQQPLLSAQSQESVSRINWETPVAQKPAIVVTKTLSPQPSEELIDLHGMSPHLEKSPNSSVGPLPRCRDSLKLDLQVMTISSDGDSVPFCGHSPTIDGNRTDEILGEIDSSHLTIGEILGHGEFGSVLKGIWLNSAGDKIDVAVKTLHDDDQVNKAKFLKEACVMMNLNHMYIVKLVGVCHGPPVAMVQELMCMGSLLDFLLEHPDEVVVDFHLKLWAAQIAEGMMYLEQKHFVHRDLAARNILLSSMTLCKISDFGLTRALGKNKDCYTASDGGKWPLKCNPPYTPPAVITLHPLFIIYRYAPESINYGTFTHSSDVWSYGVTLWEMYSFGEQPYGDMPGHKVLDLLEKDGRLPCPEKCPKGVFSVMLHCWDYAASKRPSFKELAHNFRTKPEYINIKPYFK